MGKFQWNTRNDDLNDRPTLNNLDLCAGRFSCLLHPLHEVTLWSETYQTWKHLDRPEFQKIKIGHVNADVSFHEPYSPCDNPFNEKQKYLEEDMLASQSLELVSRCGDKFVGETARTLDKCIQVSHK